mmetsp:Transcript_83703/g.194687  ORF Transcript_83703/g.194687 Transcript_83703/m.194687 type:complete len:543 (-) Transcript_83703:318-1946(-)
MGALCSLDEHERPNEEVLIPARDRDGAALTNQAVLTNHAGLTNHAVASRLCKMGCGCQVQPGLRNGRPYDTCCRSCALSPAAGVHDSRCSGPIAGPRQLAPVTWFSASRAVCPDGARCRLRGPEHLAEQAHPLDKDYRQCCARAGLEPEEMSLKVLFDWADADGSGKLSKEELAAALHVINSLRTTADDEEGSTSEITDEAWKKLDEDGNGLVNFNEFACWAGPRLGLPLGVRKMLIQSRSKDAMALPCDVCNCPCEAYKPGPWGRCKSCKHKKSCHSLREAPDGEIPFPDYWTIRGSDQPHTLVSMTAVATKEFQQLLDRTYKNIWTRDRSKHNPENKKVPSGFEIVAVHRNENCGNWQEYCIRRAHLLTSTEQAPADGHDRIELVDDVLTTVAWRDIGGDKAGRLLRECNEWYLFHGTSPSAARTICGSDFKLTFAGENTGTLYGRGLYFAESVTKADEYARPNSDGTYAVLMCRILGGRVKYTDEVSPNVEALVQSVTEGPYDSVLGDRAKCRGTFREFVIFDTEDVYPEYIITYKRKY